MVIISDTIQVLPYVTNANKDNSTVTRKLVSLFPLAFKKSSLRLGFDIVVSCLCTASRFVREVVNELFVVLQQ